MYYLTRSQPPLLSEMLRAHTVHVLRNATTSAALPQLAEALRLLGEEYRFWMRDPVRVGGQPYTDPGGHAVLVQSGAATHVLNRSNAAQ